jgi:hypothetical protein
MSMLVVGVTASAVLMAADSRQFPSGRDTVQKLFLAGRRSLLGHSGIGVIPSGHPEKDGVWDAAIEVERIAKVLPSAYPKDQFAFISDAILKSLNDGLAKRPLAIDSQNAQLTIMFVDRDAGGRVFFARREFRIISVNGGGNTFRHHAEAGEPNIVLDRVRTDRGLWWDVPPSALSVSTSRQRQHPPHLHCSSRASQHKARSVPK